MIPEALLILACTSTTGCNETLAQYKVYNPELNHIAAQAEKLAKPYLFQYWGPFIALAFRNEGVLAIHTNVNLKLERERTNLVYSLEF